MAKLLSGTRIYGTATVDTQLFISGTTAATSTITGALQVIGGVGIGGNLYVGGVINATVTGLISTATNIAGGTIGQLHYQTGPGATGFAGPGTAGQLLVSGGAAIPVYTNTASIYVSRAVLADTATNLPGGAAGSVPYQTGAGATTMLALASTAGYVITAGAGSVYWSSPGVLTAGQTDAVKITNDVATATPQYVTFVSTSTGYTGIKTAYASGLTYVPSTGNYGINVAIPSSKLDVGGTVKISGITSVTNNTNATSAITGALQVTGGVGVGSDVYIGGNITQTGGTHATNATTFNLVNTNATTVNFAGAGTTVGIGAASGTTTVKNNLTVVGNLTVQGTTTVVDSTVTNVSDPILTLGGLANNAAPTLDDNKDKGIAFKWFSGAAKTGFFGFDDSTGFFTFVPDATFTNEVISGTKGAVDASLAGGSAQALVYQSSPNVTAYLAAGSAGQILQTNGTGAAPSWVPLSGTSAGFATTATNAINVITSPQTVSGTYFATFVSSNGATSQPLYTTSSFAVNPATGFVSIGNSSTGNAPLNVFSQAALGGVAGNYIPIFTQQASGGTANTVYETTWRTRASVGTDWTTQKLHNGVWVDASFLVPGTSTRTWWERFPNSGSQAWGDSASTLMFLNSSGQIFLTGGSTQLNTGFTNKLNVTGSIVAGTATSTSGSTILQGNYGTGAITTFGTEFSSGGPVIGYGVTPSTAAAATFFSASGIALNRGAYTIAGNVHNWYNGASQTVAIGSAVTMSLGMTLNASGNLGIGLGTTAPNQKLTVQSDMSLYTTNDTAGTTSILLGSSTSMPQGIAMVKATKTAVGAGYLTLHSASGGTLNERLRITALGGVSFGATGTAVGTTGQILQSNGDASPTWVSPSGLAAGSTANINATANTNAFEYIVGVAASGSNTAAATVATTNPIGFNASTGKVGIGTITPISTLTVETNSATAPAASFYGGTAAANGTMTLPGGLVRQRATVTIANYWAASTNNLLNIYNNTNDGILFVRGDGNVGIGTTTPGFKLEVNGAFAATTKSFLITHPTKKGMKLRYGSLEGPENGIYVRGKLKGTNKIELPEYWTKLVDPDSITVSLTSIGKHQDLFVEDIYDNVVTVGNGNILSKAINCFYVVYGERADVEKLVVEI